MGLKDLLTGRSSKEQSDCCNVEIVPTDEDDTQQNDNAEASQREDGSCCQDDRGDCCTNG